MVADEVRALAKRTQQSTEEIERLVSTLRSAAQSSVQQIQHSGELVKLAVSDALETESALGSIATAVSLIQQAEQHQGLLQLLAGGGDLGFVGRGGGEVFETHQVNRRAVQGRDVHRGGLGAQADEPG